MQEPTVFDSRLIDMRCALLVVAISISCVIADAEVTAVDSVGQDTTVAARTLVPLLKDVRASIVPRVQVEPGVSLPPSPITGRSSTLFAVRIGVRERQVDERVVEAMDRLLRWDTRSALREEDRDLVERWLDELSTKVLARLAAAGLLVPCDEVCVVQRLANPDSVFGVSAKDRQETRDDLLLQALIDAVNEP